jgi:hypothetical protein
MCYKDCTTFTTFISLFDFGFTPQFSRNISYVLGGAQSLKKEGDKLLTPLAKQLHPYCEACGMQSSVGHHFIEKSRSNLLRFDLRNIISLCQSCHTKIHNQFRGNSLGTHDVVERVIKSRGTKWYKELRSLEHKSIKADIIFWSKMVEELKSKVQ